ncbi:NAD(P)-binding protein [Periconia macrospinosa]|uniref:D-xylose 1-dehydrogenase (NADP(+), D-xylono-1,5-lactone-forming) n=1 Tax=Periconia macrospinosa TaxID=97972 RepID=A0A2V1DTN9_9PLEO|nr:NAD(P)-binding protein [Periconia macrospinosa]
MAAPLRWGILGTSFISHTVVNAIIQSAGSTAYAVFGRNTDRLTAFADKFSIQKRYTTINELLDDPSVDVVYVGLPNHMHHDAVVAAAARGKPLLSEKSLCTTLEDARTMRDACRNAKVFFIEGLMYLCHPFMEKVGEIVKSGELGTIRSVNGHYAANIWKKANPLGLGTIYNLGCYPVSLMHFVVETAFGRDVFVNRTIQASGNRNKDTDVIQDASLVVKFENGVLGNVFSTDSYGNDFGFTVMGDKAVMRFKTNPWLPKAGENVIEIKPYSGEARQVVVEGEFDAFGYQVRKVEEYLKKGSLEAVRPSLNLDQSVDLMALLTEWEHSIS